MKTYYTGTRGTVRYDGGTFYDVKSWELTAELVPIEVTSLGDLAPRYRYSRPIYAGRMEIIPANAKKFETDAKRVTADLFRTAVSPSTALHELTLITGDGNLHTTYRCQAAFSDVQFQNSIDGRPILTIGFLVDGLLLDANWDATQAFIIDTGIFELTFVPISFDYFRTELSTLALNLTLNPISLSYFSISLTTLPLTLTMRPIELRYFALDLTTQQYTVTFNDLDLTYGVSDPYFSSVELLLKGEGVDGGTVITDSSINSRTPATNNGTVTSTADFKFGSASLFMNNTSIFSNKGLSYSVGSGDAFGTGDYTIELFFKIDPSNPSAAYFVVVDTNTGSLIVDSQGAVRWLNEIWGPNFNVSNNVWYHLAATRENSVVRVFLNGTALQRYVTGVPSGTTFSNTTNHTSTTWYLGRRFDGQLGYYGFLDEVRITTGVARYNSNFTPPTATFPES